MKNQNKENKAKRMMNQRTNKMIQKAEKSMKLTQVMLFSVFFILFATNVQAEQDILKYKIRKEIVKQNGILVSQPKSFDKAVSRILNINKIKTLEDYSKWLKKNIKYQKDSSKDVWATPQETLNKKEGDCEDFAFLTAEVLRGLGYDPHFYALVREGEAHAICVFKKDGFYYWFDNATLKKTNARNVRDFARLITQQYDFLQLSELNTQTQSWTTLYRRS